MHPGASYPGGFWPGVAEVVVRGTASLPYPNEGDAFLDAKTVSVVAVVRGGPEDGAVLDPLEGSVSVSLGEPGRTLSTSLAIPDDWSAERMIAAFDPRSGVEIQMQAVSTVDGGASRVDALGVFAVLKSAFTMSGLSRSVELSCPDRTTRARRAGMWDQLKIPAGKSIVAGLEELLRSRCPWLPLRLIDDDYRAGGELLVGEVGGDVWAEAVTLAESVGCRLRVDPSGAAVMSRVLPAAATAAPAAVWVDTRGTLTDLSRELDGESATDGVIVPWSGGRVTVPDSGRAAYVKWEGDDTLITSEAQARAAGFAYLAKVGGVADTVAGEVVADYSIDAGDTVLVGSAGLGVWRHLVIESLSVPLDGAPMAFTASTRQGWGELQ